MRSTPYITIYTQDHERYSFLYSAMKRATLIFSKNLSYNGRLRRTRLNIHLTENEELVYPEGSIKDVKLAYPAEKFLSLSEQERFDLLLKILHDACILVGTSEGWNLLEIENAYHVALKGNTELVWYTAFKTNKIRTMKARVKMIAEGHECLIVLAEFFHKTDFLFEVHIIDTFLVQEEWSNTFSKPLWLDDERFGFNLSGGQVSLAVDVKTKSTSVSLTEKYLSREELEGYLRRLQYRKFATRKEMIDWMNN